MPTDVVMPQMGESIFEGTITKWLKKAGDAVEKDEPLFEISTDKVDAEIPAPVSGTLIEIRIGEGATVEVNTVVAVIGDAGDTVNPSTDQQTKEPSQAVPEVKRVETKEAPKAPSEEKTQASTPQANSGSTEVVMPQMGESIFEGTITKWLKKTGDRVEKDEPLFEISTDKVDAEIPSPVAGVLTEIKVAEGATVEVNTVVAVIGGASEASAGTDSVDKNGAQGAVAQGDGSPTGSAADSNGPETEARAAAEPSPAAMPPPAQDATPEPEFNNQPIRSSPLVRRIARENNLDLRRIQGSGSAGRINKEDVLRFMKDGGSGMAAKGETVAPAAVDTPGSQSPGSQSKQPTPATVQKQASVGAGPAIEGKLEPMSRMRSIIAQRMKESYLASPHAYVVYKVDMTRVVRLRERERAGFEQRHGVKLTYMPFIAAAAVDALRKFPVVNASIEGNAIRYHENIHLGLAVALDWGLIVPVARESERRSFSELAKMFADLAERARGKKLKPEEASGSTFTLTNPGVFGGEFGTPIINQPEAAILAIGGLKKEPVVLTDADGNDTIAIRSMQSYCLGFDHRIIDGADAGKFMTAFKDALEKWDRAIG